MQFKISTLTALLAASTSVSAGTISGDQVIEVLDSLTNQVGDLNSKLQSTEDPITLSQELLSSEKDIAALELGEIIINSAEPTLFPATQLDVCQAIITFIDVDTGFLRFLVGDGSFITPDLKPTQAVLRSLGSIVDSIASSILGLVPDCADDIRARIQKLLADVQTATETDSVPS